MTAEELIQDQSFINWSTGKVERDIKYWDSYLEDHPEKAPLILEARGIILSNLMSDDPSISSIDLNQAWSDVDEKIRYREKRRSVNRILAWTSVAAVIAIMISGLFYLIPDHVVPDMVTQIESTQPGEIRTINLPDGSLVTLNGNSSIEYPINLDQLNIRNVQVTGEVFFEVFHNETPFKVLLEEAVEVTVLGTKFNVNSRSPRKRISLLEGRVDVKKSDGKQVVLSPGQSAYVDSGIQVTQEDVAALASWKDYTWKFKNTPVSEVVDRLINDFGIKVSVRDESINDRMLSGNLSTHNLEVLYQALETLLDIRIERDKEGIILLQN